VNPNDGSTLYGPRRLAGIRRVFASPVGAAGRSYIADRDGTTLVLKQGAQFELLARNQLDDSFSASPAVAGNELFLRGEHHLYCLANDK
jgi:outer membrane protein assembly factor BamB